MEAQRWTRWVAIALVVLVALGGSVIGALSLAGGDDPSAGTSSPPDAAAGGDTTLVLPRQPLGWDPVEGADSAAARKAADEFGKGFGARTVYAEYAHAGSSLEFTGIIPGAGTDLGRALAESPDKAISHQFVNVGLGEGTPYPSGVPGVSLRCGEPRPGAQACIWADGSVLALMVWRLREGRLEEAARLTASLVPAFRQPA